MTPARYPGRCGCGARFRAGDPVTFGEGFRVRGALVVQYCPTCRPVMRRCGPGIEVYFWGRVVTVYQMRDVATGRLDAYQIIEDGEVFAPPWCNVKADTLEPYQWSRDATHWLHESAIDIVSAAYLLDVPGAA